MDGDDDRIGWMLLTASGKRCNELRIGMYKRETVEELIHNRRE